MSQPVAGWYPDPAGSPRLRWWNGSSWTEQFQPMPNFRQQPIPAPMRSVPVPTPGVPAAHNAPMQQGGARGIPAPQPRQPVPAQQGAAQSDSSAPSGPRMPSSQQAPKVHPNPYQNTGVTPVFSDDEDTPAQKGSDKKAKASSGQGWFIGMFAAWILVVILAATAVYTGLSYSSASKDLAKAESEHAAAQAEYDEAQSGLEQAQKELTEAQK